METYFEDHCVTCDTVAEREATRVGHQGQWTCEFCGEATVWDTYRARSLAY